MINLLPETIVSPLKKGDEVITVAASSALEDEESLLAGLNVFKSWGLSCREQNVVGRYWHDLAGDDVTRFNELHPQKGAPLIAFARGGWGAARLLERTNPWAQGWILGYSDLTSILLSRLSKGFDGGIHGPLITSLAKEPQWSKERLKALLFGLSIPDLIGETWSKGVAKGPLVAANLTVASHLLGSRHIPDLKGAILVLEDTNEESCRIDRMLTHWRLAGKLKDLAGIGFGQFIGCDSPKESPKDQSFQIEEILRERTHDLGIPIVGNLPIGHCIGNAALPLGRQALIDGSNGVIKVFSS